MEYGLLLAGIAALLAVVIWIFGAQVLTLFDDTCETIKSKGGAPTAGSCT